MYELRIEEFSKASSIFSELPDTHIISSVIEGNCEGRIFANDSNIPTAVFGWDKTGHLFLAGDSADDSFCRAVNKIISTEVYSEQQRMGHVQGELVYAEEWESKIDVVFANKHPMEDSRRLYQLDGGCEHARYQKPDGFTVKLVDESLLNKTHLKNINGVIEEIQSMWGSVESFIKKQGFGYCALHGDEVAGWCLSEYPSNGSCGVGIETFENYRRRGIATLMTSAFMKHCVANNIELNWRCWESNVGSAKTAEKAGLKLATKYPVYFFWWNEIDNLLVNGGRSHHLKRYGEALKWYEEAFRLAEQNEEVCAASYLFSKVENRGIRYYYAAEASACIGEIDFALQYLRKAIAHGWKDKARLITSEDWSSLREIEEWNEILVQIN